MTHTDPETELRARFARAADEIPVGPPPTGDGLCGSVGRRRRTWRTVAVAAATGGIVVAAAVVSSRLDTGSEEESAAPRTDASASESPQRLWLDCPNRFRSITHLDTWEPKGLASAAAVAVPYVDQAAGETVHVVAREDRTHVWILRPDGTARARLEASYSTHYDGWLLGTVYTCGDESLVPPRHRP